jgi:uncharacterized membrane protein HdeD (DUF308 family)
MSTDNDSLEAMVPAEILGDLVHNWGWLLALGILLIVLGTIGLGLTIWLTLATVFIFGVFLLIGGVVQIVHAFKCQGWQSTLWQVIIGILYILAALIIMDDPIMASTLLTLLLGGVLLGIGAVRIVIALQHRDLQNWLWPLIGGIAAVILGFLILIHWPISGFWVIGLFVAIEMIFSGWSYIIIALGARELAHQHTHTTL